MQDEMWLGIGNFLLADLTQMAFIPTMSRLFATASTAASYLGKIQNAFWGDHKITHSVIINGIIMTFFNKFHYMQVMYVVFQKRKLLFKVVSLEVMLTINRLYLPMFLEKPISRNCIYAS